jgi:hypothetical protein
MISALTSKKLRSLSGDARAFCVLGNLKGFSERSEGLDISLHTRSTEHKQRRGDSRSA